MFLLAVLVGQHDRFCTLDVADEVGLFGFWAGVVVAGGWLG